MCHDTNDCIVTGGADLVSRYSAPGLRYGVSALQHGVGGCDTAGSSTRRCAVTRRMAQRAKRPVRAATRPGEGCDMAGGRPATLHSARAVCAQAGPRVDALCTRLSFDSGHSF